ncbi:MAG TPA: hypothetical protein VNQ33_05850 [Acidimicrobiales bacterium]|nr:hypothetical protein [Acidimicrobiales bacterium]
MGRQAAGASSEVQNVAWVLVVLVILGGLMRGLGRFDTGIPDVVLWGLIGVIVVAAVGRSVRSRRR